MVEVGEGIRSPRGEREGRERISQTLRASAALRRQVGLAEGEGEGRGCCHMPKGTMGFGQEAAV